MTVTKTFQIALNSAYVADSVVEVVTLPTNLFETDDLVAVYLEAIDALIQLKGTLSIQIYPVYDGSETDAQKLVKYEKAIARSQKIGLQLLKKKQGSTSWIELTEIQILNTGSKQQLDFLPRYMTQASVRVLEKNDVIGIKLINYGNGLIKGTDYINLDFSVRLEVSKKKDSTEILLEEIRDMLQNPQQSVNSFSSSNGAQPFALTTTPTTILSDRTATKSRKEFYLYNSGTANVLFNYGSTVSTSIFVAEILPGGFWRDFANHQGPVVARAKDNATNLSVTELIII